jgi:hypothetical protein
MPRVNEFTPALNALIARQYGVISWCQLARHGVTRSAVQHRLRRGWWQRIRPGVFLTHSGEPTRIQRVVAAQLWAGDEAAIDAASACHHFGLIVQQFDPRRVDVVAPFGSSARTDRSVRVRRTLGEIEAVTIGAVRYVPEPIAVLVTARNARTYAEAVATLSDALRRGIVTVQELRAGREMLGDKWCKRLDRALVEVGVGIRSAGESLFRGLILTSRVLPEPLWNQWLDLGDGGWPICADGLWKEAAMLHEVNGRAYHAWGEQYEKTSARTERVVTAELVHTQSTPLRLSREGSVILVNLERTYLKNLDRPWPAGVQLIAPPSWAIA